jgi:hypothetical protein
VGLAGFGYSLASRKHRAPAEAGGE